LLAHDPPGLWEQLSLEASVLEEDKKLQAGLARMVAAGQVHQADRWRWKSDADEDHLAGTQKLLLMYTTALRAKENDSEWLLKQQVESLELFPSSNDGVYGITYFQSYFRVFNQSVIQKALRAQLLDGQTQTAAPKVVVLGSALGGAAVWPALAFGFRATGFDVLPGCVEAAKRIAAVTEPALKYLHTHCGRAGDAPSCAEFHCVDVVKDNTVVSQDLKDATVVWANDFTWPKEAQRCVEETVLQALPEGGVLVLYRPPHTAPYLWDSSSAIPVGSHWEDGGRVRIATSWDPNLEMHLLVKAATKV